jgi:hypothetical protein
MAFAASDAHASARGAWQPLSVEWAYYHGLKRDGGQPHEGVYMDSMLQALRLDGQPEEGAWPYIASLFTNLAAWNPPKAQTLFRRDSKAETATVKGLVTALDMNNPVVFTMSISKSFYRPAADGLIEGTEPLEPRRVHALVAVGHGFIGSDTYVLVRNSWGHAWGIAGHGWIGSSYLQPRLLQAASMTGAL